MILKKVSMSTYLRNIKYTKVDQLKLIYEPLDFLCV